MSSRVEIGGRCQIQTDEWLITIAEVQAQCHRSLGQSSTGWSWNCTNMWLSPPLLSRQDLYCLGESIHLEIEKAYGVPVSQGHEPCTTWTRGLLGERLVTSSGSFTCLPVLTPPTWPYFTLRQAILPWLFCCLKGKKCQQRKSWKYQEDHPTETSYTTDWIPLSEFTEASQDLAVQPQVKLWLFSFTYVISRLFTISHLSAFTCNGCTPPLLLCESLGSASADRYLGLSIACE